MASGQTLKPGQAIKSANGAYLFAMQADGNLVLYKGVTPRWATNTNGKPVAVCIMQSDGNLVLYDAQGRAIWASNTNGNPGARLFVQSDGNVVIYTGSRAIWATNTVDQQASAPVNVSHLAPPPPTTGTTTYEASDGSVITAHLDATRHIDNAIATGKDGVVRRL